MRILVVDDEPLARGRLKALLAELPGTEVVGEAASGAEAVARAEALGPDLVLLDIRMPGMDGLEAAQALAALNPPPAVIFTTAYGEHALDAFEAEAIDYLLKPVRRERLAQALAKAARLRPAPAQAPAGLAVTRHGRLIRIPLEAIVFLHAEDKYVTVHTATEQVLTEESLKSLEESYPERFLRIHRNALVAREALTGMRKCADGGFVAQLRGSDEELEISRRHVSAVRRFLKGRQ